MEFRFSERDKARIFLFRKMRHEADTSRGKKVLLARITTNAIFAPGLFEIVKGKQMIIPREHLPPWAFMQYKRFFRSDS